ncbi:uncharacterized protein [Amphiura filiformis]|uniref:uncharacterized protein n=1 Tax=Amphiura filiformis TaxID=82378 RepID=UPI003B2284D0
MENGDQETPQETTAAEQVIISENEQKDNNVYEQQISVPSETQDSPPNEPEKGTSESVNNDEPSVRPKEPRESMNGEKKRKEEIEEAEDRDDGTAVLQGNEVDYREYKHDTPEEIRKQQLRELAPEHTANIRGIHHHHEYKKVQPESFLWLSMFTVIFFSRIFGAIALYKSVKVRLLFLEGKLEESEEASKAAKKWNIVGMIFCLCWVIFVLVILKGVGLFDMKEG